MLPPPIPTQFPVWCRAVYSWGGESKHDLGFLEGDLIQCLNAGDGSWWSGKLRRDPRRTGLFPSNFVQVLDNDFRPTSISRTPSPHPSNAQPPQKTKPKVFRKPFGAYAAPDQAALKRAEVQKQNSISNSRAPSPAVPKDRNPMSRAISPLIHGYGSRATSPAPPLHNSHISRAPSPAPPAHYTYMSRSPSPASVHNAYISRAPSPAPSFHDHFNPRDPSPTSQFDVGSSPPPPAPPPHRRIYTKHESNDSHHVNFCHTPRSSSAQPPSRGATGHTPSPLRSAMDDVMSSLADMGVPRDTHSPDTPLDPWSPEAFDQKYIRSQRIAAPRPNTAMGIGGQSGYEVDTDELHFDAPRSVGVLDEPSPQLSNYVERMESRLSQLQRSSLSIRDDDPTPAVPPKSTIHDRPKSSIHGSVQAAPKLRHRKSAFEVGRSVLGRTFTTKTTSTNSSSGTRSTTTNTSSSTHLTDRSIMSGPSASGFSSTSAGSLARRKDVLQSRTHSAMGSTGDNSSQSAHSGYRPQSAFTGVSFHSSHASGALRARSQTAWHTTESENTLGGLVAPKPKKSGFFKKMIESARTGAASARSNIAAGDTAKSTNPLKMPQGVTSVAGPFTKHHSHDAASEMGLGGHSGIDWVQVRRDVNRSNSLSRIEMVERKERCQMMDYPAISPVEELLDACEGDEGAEGTPVSEPTNFQAVNFSLVDKNARFINSLPPMTNAISLAAGFVCRPYRSDVQRLRAIFTWVSEKITWEKDFESEGDSRRLIHNKRGCPEEVAILVMEMCSAVGIRAEVIRGFLKTPGEVPELNIMPRSNHWWNAVIVDGEWRILDCSLASSSHPSRNMYSSMGGQQAESWWFLARPMEVCWTHIPEQHDQQHLCPPIAQEVLLALPCACPPYFKNELQMVDYDTSLIRIEDLELVHVKFTVPADVECIAEVEARAFERDADGDFFESGDIIKKRALAQAEWVEGQKRYTVKALLPGDEGYGVLKIFAGKRGLMHSIKDIPHPLALAFPIMHTGENPSYEFLTRHPTPHAQRHDLYVAQPQCQRLAVNHTFVFAIRQHPSSAASALPDAGATSPMPFMRPSSALSFTDSSASGSNPSTRNAYSSKKPAKLAIQAPSGKVLRLMRKDEKVNSTSQGMETGDGGTWETIIKCGETGVWRGLVLADRSARWAVFAEWTCV